MAAATASKKTDVDYDGPKLAAMLSLLGGVA
jgi:hypothetical protein